MALSAVKKEQPKQKDAEAAPAPKPKKSKAKWIILGATLTLLPAIGGGAYWYLNKDKEEGAAAKVEAPKPPIFVSLDTFTVNLQVEEVPQFLQVGLSLRVSEPTVGDSVKLHMPEIRNSILLLLSSQKASELVTLQGKNKLSADIVAAVNGILSPPKPAAKRKPAPKPAEEGEASAEASDEAKAEGKDAETAAKDGGGDDADAPKPAKKKPAAKPAAALPIVSVLFTSFIVQ